MQTLEVELAANPEVGFCSWLSYGATLKSDMPLDWGEERQLEEGGEKKTVICSTPETLQDQVSEHLRKCSCNFNPRR